MEKLIRSNIRPENGTLRYVDGNEYSSFLRMKLGEELFEFGEAETNKELIEEAADVLEVLYTIFEEHDLSLEEIERYRMKKRKERGSFREGLVWNDED